MNKVMVSELEMIGWACPTQWEGKTPGLERVYIRYRYGMLSVSVDSIRVASMAVGSEFSGVMETDEMKQHLADVLEFA